MIKIALSRYFVGMFDGEEVNYRATVSATCPEPMVAEVATALIAQAHNSAQAGPFGSVREMTEEEARAHEAEMISDERDAETQRLLAARREDDFEAGVSSDPVHHS